MLPVPSITIYTRHAVDCTYKGDPFYKRCSCLKSLRYSLHGKMQWKATKQRTWAGAERFKREFEDSFNAPAEVKSLTVRATVAAFVQYKQGEGISPGFLAKYILELGRLVNYCERKNRHMVRQITLQDLSDFRSEWAALYPSSSTRQSVQGRLRGFFKYCLHDDLVSKNTASGLSPIKVDTPPTLPLDREQYATLLATIPEIFKDPIKRSRIRALIQCMRHSGLAVGDAVCLRRDRLSQMQGHSFITTARQKNDNAVLVPIPPEVALEIVAVPNQHPDYFFWSTGASGGGKKESIIHQWQRDLRTLFHKSGMPAGHPHQLRDTFAVEMLTAGVPLVEVSKMLGHSSIQTTEKHYLAWVKSRQDRLIELVVSTFKNSGAPVGNALGAASVMPAKLQAVLD